MSDRYITFRSFAVMIKSLRMGWHLSSVVPITIQRVCRFAGPGVDRGPRHSQHGYSRTKQIQARSQAATGMLRCNISCRFVATWIAVCAAWLAPFATAQDAAPRPETPVRVDQRPAPQEPADKASENTAVEAGNGAVFESDLPEISFAQVLDSFGVVRRWVDHGGVPDLDGTPLPQAWIASVILRNSSGIIGQHTAIARSPDDSALTVRRAATKAITRAVNRVQGPPDALRRARILESLAGARLSIEISTARPAPVADGISAAQLDSWLRPGLEGMLLRLDGFARARTPAVMLSAGVPASTALVSLVAELAEDPTVALTPFDQLVDSGYELSFFRVQHAAQARPDSPPLLLHRGGGVVAPVRTAELADLAGRISAHIRGRAWPGVERLGLRGDLDPVTGIFAKGGAPPFGQALAAEALLRYASAPGGDPTEATRARVAAETILAALAVVEGDERAPWGDAVTASACLNALAIVDRAAIESSGELRGLRERCVPMVAGAFDTKAGFDPMIPAAARGVVARALLNLAKFEPWNRESHLVRAESAIRQAYRESTDSQLLSLMPDLAWADIALARATGIDPPSAAALRALRSRVIDLQLGKDDLVEADRDLAGGFVLDVAGSPLPTWQSARAAALLATMLGEPSLTRGSLASGEIAPELLNLSRSLRFIKQLTADERAAHMYADPGLGIGGVRVSLWDQEMPLSASALGLIAVTESLESFDSITTRTRPAAGGP